MITTKSLLIAVIAMIVGTLVSITVLSKLNEQTAARSDEERKKRFIAITEAELRKTIGPNLQTRYMAIYRQSNGTTVVCGQASDGGDFEIFDPMIFAGEQFLDRVAAHHQASFCRTSN